MTLFRTVKIDEALYTIYNIYININSSAFIVYLSITITIDMFILNP